MPAAHILCMGTGPSYGTMLTNEVVNTSTATADIRVNDGKMWLTCMRLDRMSETSERHIRAGHQSELTSREHIGDDMSVPGDVRPQSERSLYGRTRAAVTNRHTIFRYCFKLRDLPTILTQFVFSWPLVGA